MNRATFAVAGVVAVLFSGNAAKAASSVTAAPSFGTPDQVAGSRNFQSGLRVIAQSTTNFLTAAGGYTVSCPNSIPFQPSRAPTFQGQGGEAVGEREVFVPATAPSTTSATGWDQWPAGSTQTCNFQYVGRSSDAHVTSSGLGHNLVLSAGGAQDQTISNRTLSYGQAGRRWRM
jgi:hypothetical protein